LRQTPFFQGENENMKNFRTYQLAVSFFRLCNKLKLPMHLSDQLRRASVSIVCNLAEGRGKPTRKDQLKYFHIAFGSVRECQALLTLAELDNSELYKLLDSIAAHLYLLIKKAH
jgi:four helix bundle protein